MFVELKSVQSTKFLNASVNISDTKVSKLLKICSCISFSQTGMENSANNSNGISNCLDSADIKFKFTSERASALGLDCASLAYKRAKLTTCITKLKFYSFKKMSLFFLKNSNESRYK